MPYKGRYTVAEIVDWANEMVKPQRKSPKVTIGPPPPHVEKLAAFGSDMQEMREAWEAYDKTMLLSDNDAREADVAFAAVRAQQRRAKK